MIAADLLITEAQSVAGGGNIAAVGAIDHERTLEADNEVAAFVLTDFVGRKQIDIVHLHQVAPKSQLPGPALKPPSLESLADAERRSDALFSVSVAIAFK